MAVRNMHHKLAEELGFSQTWRIAWKPASFKLPRSLPAT
jgi:hypothetical protein